MNKIKTVLAIMTVIACIGLASYVETHYTMYATVSQVDGKTIILTNSQGEDFIYETEVSDETFEECNIVKIAMYNNHSEHTISDDKITKIKKLK